MGRRWVRCDHLALVTVSFSRMIETGTHRFVIILTGTILYICAFINYILTQKRPKRMYINIYALTGANKMYF
jgi:hypothetical protein